MSLLPCVDLARLRLLILSSSAAVMNSRVKSTLNAILAPI